MEQAAQLVRVDLGIVVLVCQGQQRCPPHDGSIGCSVQIVEALDQSRRGLVSGEDLEMQLRTLFGSAPDRAEQSNLVARLDPLIEQGDGTGFQRGPLRSLLRLHQALHPRNRVLVGKRRQGQVKQ